MAAVPLPSPVLAGFDFLDDPFALHEGRPVLEAVLGEFGERNLTIASRQASIATAAVLPAARAACEGHVRCAEGVAGSAVAEAVLIRAYVYLKEIQARRSVAIIIVRQVVTAPPLAQKAVEGLFCKLAHPDFVALLFDGHARRARRRRCRRAQGTGGDPITRAISPATLGQRRHREQHARPRCAHECVVANTHARHGVSE